MEIPLKVLSSESIPELYNSVFLIVIIHFIVFVVRLFVLNKSTTSANVEDGPHEVKLPSGWLARDVAAAAARLKPKGGDANASGARDASKPIPATSPGVTTGASAVEDDLCGRLRVYALTEDIMSSERRDLTEATARITSLSTQLAEARRERDDVRIEYGNMGDDYRELETKLRNTFADAQSMKRRVHAAEAEANALRERVGVLEEAMNAIGRLAYTQGDRTFDDAMRVLSWIDDECRSTLSPPAAIHTRDDDE